MKFWLYLIIVINIFLLIKSFSKIKKSKKTVGFTYFKTFLIGAWVWEDVFVLSFLHILFALLTIIFNDLRVGLLCLLVFWAVRNLGEAIYYMLQQFIQPKFHPHYINEQFSILRKIFGNISDQKCFILIQVFFQSLLTLSIILLFLLIRNWEYLPAKL